MRYIDPHLHTVLLDDGVMMKIALTGMEACVMPMLHCLNGISEADAGLALWDRFPGFELKRGSAVGYEAFASPGVPFYRLIEKKAPTNVQSGFRQLRIGGNYIGTFFCKEYGRSLTDACTCPVINATLPLSLNFRSFGVIHQFSPRRLSFLNPFEKTQF